MEIKLNTNVMFNNVCNLPKATQNQLERLKRENDTLSERLETVSLELKYLKLKIVVKSIFLSTTGNESERPLLPTQRNGLRR